MRSVDVAARNRNAADAQSGPISDVDRSGPAQRRLGHLLGDALALGEDGATRVTAKHLYEARAAESDHRRLSS